ncbi:hypothetical protein ACLB2K_016170 [Fragaria x ananassa]
MVSRDNEPQNAQPHSDSLTSQEPNHFGIPTEINEGQFNHYFMVNELFSGDLDDELSDSAALKFSSLDDDVFNGIDLTTIARLNLDGKSSNCWDLIHLQACSSEVIVFFKNGQTYLGQGCCLAIRTIEHQCWPALLGSLGFFPEETDILRGYCYANQLETSLTLPRPFDEATGKFVPDLEKYIP